VTDFFLSENIRIAKRVGECQGRQAQGQQKGDFFYHWELFGGVR
jgi:hypothetical protein